MDFVHHAVSIFEIVGQANRVKAHIRMSLFLVMFLAGWNDASQGPLLPSLQEYYNVNYTISTWPHHVIVRLMSSINNLGCKFRRIRSGWYFQCLVNGSTRFRYCKFPSRHTKRTLISRYVQWVQLPKL
jgi:hypothetical protein